MHQIRILLIALPFAVAFLVSMVFAPGMIAALKRRRVGQVISEDGPESHRNKEGTPTMGGLIILAGILGAAFVLTSGWVFRGDNMIVRGASYGHGDLLAVVLLMLSYALLGVVDDALTVRPSAARGIPSKPKAAIQILLAVAFVLWLAYGRPDGFLPMLVVGGTTVLAGVWYYVFAVVFIVGMANFVNITDGLDGLACGLMSIAAAAFVVCPVFVPGIVVEPVNPMLFSLLSAVAGACLAFLWFNANPAKVFMGDTGSLALGVVLPAIGIMAHREVLVIIVGLIFVLDGLSSALQWAVFKFTRVTTGTGKRVFKKSPVHHHFELSGWAEQAIVARFWILGVVAAVLGLAGATWRIW